MRVKKSKLLAVLSSLVAPRSASMAAAAAAAPDRSILSELDAAVARCTDRHDAPADEKNVHEILYLVSNAPGSITFLSRLLSARLEATRDPTVALKTLLLLHRLLRGGDRYFEQDLRGMWTCGELRMDLSWSSAATPGKGGVPARSFLLGYSQFLEERLGWIINQAGALEPIRPSKEEAPDWTLYRLHKCQAFLDRVMDCLPANLPISSQLMQSSFNIVLKESIRVYDSFCDGMDTAMNSYSKLPKSLKTSALDIFSKACAQTSNLHDFYEHSKRNIDGKNLDYPFVRIITAAEVASFTTGSNSRPSTSSEVKEEDKLDLDETSSIQFSQKLETIISTVWVEFDVEEQDPQTCSYSYGGLEDLLTGACDDSGGHNSSWLGREATR